MTPYPYQTKHGKRFRVPYRTPNGRQRTKGGFKTKRAARAWYRRKMVEMEEHGFLDNDNVTFKQVAISWLDHKKFDVDNGRICGATYTFLERQLRVHILPTLGDKKIKAIDLQIAQKAVYTWAKQVKLFNRLVQTASKVFDFAIKYRWAFKNPFKLVDQPLPDNDTKVRSFTREQFDIFKKGLKDHYEQTNYKAYAFLFVLAHTGMRKGELLALTWDHIDLKKGLIHIDKTVTRDAHNCLIIGRKTKTPSSVRNVGIGQETIDVLKKWHCHQHHEFTFFNIDPTTTHNLVFTNQHGGILTTSKPGKWLRMIEELYGLPTYVTPHGLRHTYTVLLIDEGCPVNKVAATLGHRDASITIQVYNDLHPIEDNELGNTIESL